MNIVASRFMHIILFFGIFLIAGCASDIKSQSVSSESARFGRENTISQSGDQRNMQSSSQPYFIHKDGAMVYDQTTGLIWMRCSLGQTWTGSRCAGNAIKYSLKTQFSRSDSVPDDAINAMNSDGTINGIKDWKIPSPQQLKSLIHCSTGFRPQRNVSNACNDGNIVPTLNQVLMPNTSADYYLSHVPYISGVQSEVRAITSFKTGITEIVISPKGFVRLVRNSSVRGNPVLAGFLPMSESLANQGEIAILERSKDYGVFSQGNVLSNISKDWRVDNLKEDTQRFVSWSEDAGKAFKLSGNAINLSVSNVCSVDSDQLKDFLQYGASEIWARRGSAEIDILHSVSNESLIWIGNCANGKAEGDGILVWYYEGKINKNRTVGAVRAKLSVVNGKPLGTVFAYSNSNTCEYSCTPKRYAKEIGRLIKNAPSINVARQDLETSVNASNNAMGQLTGRALLKFGEAVKEGAAVSLASGSGSSKSNTGAISSNQSASKSSTNKTFVCEINCTNGGYRGKTQIYRDVQASSREDAGRYLNNASRGICQDLGLKATTDSFSSSQCREK